MLLRLGGRDGECFLRETSIKDRRRSLNHRGHRGHRGPRSTLSEFSLDHSGAGWAGGFVECGFNDCRKVTICQRWGSGSFDQTGMPCRTTPLVTIQKSVPDDACRTSGRNRLGARLVPPAFSPWHSAQCRSKSFPPAIASRALPSKGFRRVLAESGTSSSAAYTDRACLSVPTSAS